MNNYNDETSDFRCSFRSFRSVYGISGVLCSTNDSEVPHGHYIQTNIKPCLALAGARMLYD